jgi:hypothetical protein
VREEEKRRESDDVQAQWSHGVIYKLRGGRLKFHSNFRNTTPRISSLQYAAFLMKIKRKICSGHGEEILPVLACEEERRVERDVGGAGQCMHAYL